MSIVIAVDGTAASGKGTLARALAHRYRFDYLDTGSLYRTVGWKVLSAGKDPGDKAAAIEAAETLALPDVEDALLRFDEISRAAATVAAIQEVRLILLNLQRSIGRNPPSKRGCVMDGRDIGTVVFPAANAKLFVTAADVVRAQRRFLELSKNDPTVDEASVLRELQERDRRDMERPVSPMIPASDAVVLDTSALSIDQALLVAIAIVESKLPELKR